MCKIPEEVMGSIVQVDENEIVMARMMGKKWIVVRDGAKFYRVRPGRLTDFPKLFFGAHKCATCQNLSGIKCQKVYDMAPEYYRSQGSNPYDCFLEKYPFIQAGVEKFGCGAKGYFVVSECDNYEPDRPKSPCNPQRVDDVKVSLAQNIWPDVHDIKDVVARSLAARGEGPHRAY